MKVTREELEECREKGRPIGFNLELPYKSVNCYGFDGKMVNVEISKPGQAVGDGQLVDFDELEEFLNALPLKSRYV